MKRKLDFTGLIKTIEEINSIKRSPSISEKLNLIPKSFDTVTQLKEKLLETKKNNKNRDYGM